MMMRYSIVCPGCDEPFQVRLGLAPTKMTRFYVPCPTCKFPIRGTSSGDELDSHRIDFDADWYEGHGTPTLVVTVDPNVPARYEASEMHGLGTAPTMTLLHLVGQDRAMDLFNYLGRGRNIVEKCWPQVRRIYEYYLEGDWKRFDKSCKDLIGRNWRPVSTAHERATAAHQILGAALSEVVDDEDIASEQFLARYMKKHTTAIESDNRNYVSFIRSELSSGLLQQLQRRVFDVLDLFIQRFESWQMGLLPRVMPDERKELLGDLRLFRDEFDTLRDLYQQGFETVCKTLRYPVAVQNAVKRSDVDDFGPEVPSTLTRKNNPKDILGFEKLSNFEKLQYVGQVPGWAAWAALLDNKTRNAIGHASVRYDLRTGLVLSDTVPNGVPYLDVVTDVYGVFEALSVCPQILRSVAVISSPDFANYR